MKAIYTLGIDIAKRKFNVCLRPATGHCADGMESQFANDSSGFAELQRWLQTHQAQAVHACMEATSRYGDALALFLFQQGHQVSVVNARRIHHYARSRLARTQNDSVDAALIADFCATQIPRRWQPIPAGKRRLQDLMRTREFFVEQKIQCANRLETASQAIAEHLHKQIEHTDKVISAIQKDLQALLKEQPQLATLVELADSVTGVGLLTAAVAVAELPEPAAFEHVGQVVAFAGLDPQQKTSGDSVATVPHLSKMGSALLRKVLYMAALSALRSNPVVRALGQRLKAKGKSGKLIVAAAMRKLLRLIFGVLKSQQPFDPHWSMPSAT
jgi:transposase